MLKILTSSILLLIILIANNCGILSDKNMKQNTITENHKKNTKMENNTNMEGKLEFKKSKNDEMEYFIGEHSSSLNEIFTSYYDKYLILEIHIYENEKDLRNKENSVFSKTFKGKLDISTMLYNESLPTFTIYQKEQRITTESREVVFEKIVEFNVHLEGILKKYLDNFIHLEITKIEHQPISGQ